MRVLCAAGLGAAHQEHPLGDPEGSALKQGLPHRVYRSALQPCHCIPAHRLRLWHWHDLTGGRHHARVLCNCPHCSVLLLRTRFLTDTLPSAPPLPHSALLLLLHALPPSTSHLPLPLAASCGTFDIGNTGSVGDTGKPRMGCNASLRKELMLCDATTGNPTCASNGQDKLLNLTTGELLNVGAFQLLTQK